MKTGNALTAASRRPCDETFGDLKLIIAPVRVHAEDEVHVRLRLRGVVLVVVADLTVEAVTVVFGLLVEAPRGVLVAGDSTTFGTRLDPGLCGALEGASLLEAPVPSLLHLGAPELVLADRATTLYRRASD
jgi:hypothetical protein